MQPVLVQNGRYGGQACPAVFCNVCKLVALFAIIRFRPDVKLVTLGVVVGFTGFTGFTGLTGLTGFTGFTGFTGLTTSLQV